MPPQPSDLPSTPDPLGFPLHNGEAKQPRLQKALEGLMVTLDDELLRYRQNRSGHGGAVGASTPLKFKPQSTPARKPLDLIHLSDSAPVSASGAKSVGAATATAAAMNSATMDASTTMPPPPPPNPRLQQILAQQAIPTTAAYAPAQPQTVRMGRGNAIATYRAAPEDYLESSEALLGSLPQYSAQYAAPMDSDEEDYQPSLASQLFTPLGIGALLLLLIGSASFGYLVTSPNTLSQLRNSSWLGRWGNEEPLDLAEIDGEVPSEPAITPGLQGLGPDLSEPEFSNLDLNRVSTLPSESASASSSGLPEPLPSGAAQSGTRPTANGSADPETGAVARVRTETVTTPQGIPTPTVAPARQPQAPAAPQPQAAAPRQPVSAPAQPVQTPPPAIRVAPPAANAQPPQPLAANPTPQPLPATPGPLAQPSAPPPITQAPPAAPSPSYYVVTNYTGEQSLESARGAVGDAYVRNFPSGTQIQMGAFSQESSARSLVQQLQGQGIPAQVYSP